MKIKRNWRGLFGSGSLEIDSSDTMWSSHYKPIPAPEDGKKMSSDDLAQKIGPFCFDVSENDADGADTMRSVEVPFHIVKEIIEAVRS